MNDQTRLNQHPQRRALHNEVHARPPQALSAPLAISRVVMVCNGAQREQSRAHLVALLRNLHLPLPDTQQSYFRMDLGQFQLRWELHTEFVSWTFLTPLSCERLGDVGPAHAFDSVPQDWFAGLPGDCLSCLHLWAIPNSEPGAAALVRQLLLEDSLLASSVAGGAAEVYTDFAIHADGASRMILRSGNMTQRRLGRLVQHLRMGHPAPGFAVAAGVTGQQPPAHPGRDRATTEQPGPVGHHEQAARHAASDAVHGRGLVGGGHHLLHRRAGQLPGQGGRTTGLALERANYGRRRDPGGGVGGVVVLAPTAPQSIQRLSA